MIFGEKFRKKYALSEAGEANVKRGVHWTVITNLLVMAGIGILYMLMQGYMATFVDGAPLPKVPLYLLAVIAFLVLSFLTHYQQYHYTYSVVYDEVGHVRTSLAERLRKLPLSFFSHRDLAELTETMMSDVDRLEHVWSHVLGYLYGGYISTAIIAVMVLAYDWRLGLSCLWGVPVAFALLFGSRKLFESYALRAKAAGLDVADSIQETIENMREIRATNQGARFLADVGEKIDTFEGKQTAAELRIGIFVNFGERHHAPWHGDDGASGSSPHPVGPDRLHDPLHVPAHGHTCLCAVRPVACPHRRGLCVRRVGAASERDL